MIRVGIKNVNKLIHGNISALVPVDQKIQNG